MFKRMVRQGCRSKRLAGLLGAVMLAGISAIAVQTPIQAQTQTKVGQPSDFTIMLWGAIPGTSALLKRVKECGINNTGFATPAQLDMVQAAGLKAFVWPDLKTIETAVVDKPVIGHPAFAGYVLGSEFGTSEFAEHGKAMSVFKEHLPNKVPLICIFPSMAAPELLEAKDYREYVGKYVDVVQPTVLCYDHYALREDGTLDPDYWTSLEVMRAKGLEKDIPFWNIVQACGSLRFREPSAADFRFQAFSTLAYGGKGIVYFTYQAYPVGNYRGAPVDQFGDETITWQYLQNTNKQVLNLAPTVMKLTSTEVYHFGEVPPSGHGPSEKSLIKSMGGNFLVGDFTHSDGSKWVMIVNKDLSKSEQCWPVFRDANTVADKLSNYRTGAFAPLDHYEERFLAPGQGMLIKLKQGK
jgi:hypothetical protein